MVALDSLTCTASPLGAGAVDPLPPQLTKSPVVNNTASKAFISLENITIKSH